MPRRRYDDDDGFPDIRQKPGTPSDAFGGAYGPPDSDSESGLFKTRHRGLRRKRKRVPDLRGLAEEGRFRLANMGEDEFSKTDGSASDGRMRDVDNPEQFGRILMSMADQKSRLKDMMRKGGKMGSMHDVAKAAKAAQKAAYYDVEKPGCYQKSQSQRESNEAKEGPRGLGRAVSCGL